MSRVPNHPPDEPVEGFTEHSFECCECGSHITQIATKSTAPLCMACLWQPGWFRDAKLRALLDPEHDGKERGIDA